MLAAQCGDAEVLRVLLAADPPVNVDQQDQDEMTALFYALMSNHTTAVKMLLDAGANPRLTDYDDFSPLNYCESAETVALIVDAVPDLVNQSNNYGTKPVACITSFPALKELFRSSVRHNIQVVVNNRNEKGSTALHSHMFRMHKREWTMFLDDPMAEALSRVELLLEHGADVLAVDCDGATVLMEPLKYLDPDPYDEIETPSHWDDVDSMTNKALKMILDQILSFSSAAESVPALPSALALTPGDTEDKNDNEGEPAAKRQRM
jgi:ankyrin repeat protein